MSQPASKLESRLVALANNATAAAIRDYEPSSAARALAGAFLEKGCGCTVKEWAAAAGLSESTVYRVLRDPAAVNWVVSAGSRLASAGLGAVHARLLQQALTARGTGALRLYLERFDPEFRKQRVLERGHNVQNNFISEMSDDELLRWVRTKRGSLLGETSPSRAPSLEGSPAEVRREPRPGPQQSGLPDSDAAVGPAPVGGAPPGADQREDVDAGAEGADEGGAEEVPGC